MNLLRLRVILNLFGRYADMASAVLEVTRCSVRAVERTKVEARSFALRAVRI